MGNLGPYQDLVTEAHRLGGVEQLIESIAKAAEARAMPKAFAAGAAVTGAVVLSAGVYKLVLRRTKEREAEAGRAKARLAAKLDQSAQPGSAERGDIEPGIDTPG